MSAGSNPGALTEPAKPSTVHSMVVHVAGILLLVVFVIVFFVLPLPLPSSTGLQTGSIQG
jgi:hypothetical protein